MARPLVALAIAFGVVPIVNAQQQHGDTDTASYTPVGYCELIRHPTEYDGKRVARTDTALSGRNCSALSAVTQARHGWSLKRKPL